MSEIAIAVLPYGQKLGPKLAQLPVCELVWPLGCPERLTGKTVGGLEARDHLIVYPKTLTHFMVNNGTKAQISLILAEPSVISTKHLSLLRISHKRFWRVLSFNQGLLDRIPNGIFFSVGTTWVPEWRDLSLEKTEMCSLIASAKRNSKGHQLRHQVADWAVETGQDVRLMGHGYASFDRKAEGLAPFRFSVVIENVREQNYFSEKLVDAVLCNTVPIYWGCPNLDRFFDPAGIIQCQSKDDVIRAIAAMSEQVFVSHLPQMKVLRAVMARYSDLEKRAAEAIFSSL